MSVRIAKKLEFAARSTWAHPLGRAAAIGGAFAAGAFIVGRLVGPSVARRVGQAGGDGFAHGVDAAQRELAGLLPRGGRFG
jgi:hypothetical protein